MAHYKVRFKELKQRVGVDDVAYALGYRLDRRAGVGRYIELVLGEDGNKRDTIIVSHPNNKAAQTFFRRDGSKGDVVTLIRENLDAFIVSGKDEWQKTAKVMTRFANMPEPEYKEDREYVRSAMHTASFSSSRYEVKPLDMDHIPKLFAHRGISDETVRALAPFLALIRDRQNGKFEGFNLGFPYTNAHSDRPQGYEIRGYNGYKSKAAGTDSSHAAWVADLSEGNPEAVRHVFFCESALDAMAFYQLNRAQLGKDVALVSLGGTFSNGQITGVMSRFPDAKAYDCFDNDLAGRIYGLRLMALIEGIPMKIRKDGEGIRVEVQGKVFGFDPKRPKATQIKELFPTCQKTGQWLPPKAFKDWNDFLLNKPLQPVLSPYKGDRDRNLAERRSVGIK